MLTIQSLIQNAKQLSKSYEKNAMNAEGVIQQIATFASTGPAGQAKMDYAEQRMARPMVNTTDPKVMIASLLEQEQASAAASRKSSAAAFMAPGSSSTCKPRSLVMYAIQRESSRVKALKKENYVLKQQLQEYQFALELIMSKYRAQMMELLNQAEHYCTTILSQHDSPERLEQQAKTIALSNRLQDMKQRFEGSIGPSTEEKILEQRELLHELILEHETLVELYQISKKYGSLPSMQDLANMAFLEAEKPQGVDEAMLEAEKENQDPEVESLKHLMSTSQSAEA